MTNFAVVLFLTWYKTLERVNIFLTPYADFPIEEVPRHEGFLDN